MSFQEICDAINYFVAESFIGAGIIDIMYKARLPNGFFEAVKVLYDS